MKFKALLLDIDNTLYDYNSTHNIAKKSVVEFCKNKFNIDEKVILKAYEKASGKKIAYKIVPRRAGDISSCYANPQKAKELLGWEAKRTLEDMCKSSFNWQSKNPNGYKKG